MACFVSLETTLLASYALNGTVSLTLGAQKTTLPFQQPVRPRCLSSTLSETFWRHHRPVTGTTYYSAGWIHPFEMISQVAKQTP